MGMIANLIINGLAVYITSYILPGLSVDNFFTALLVSLVLGIVNTFIKPLLFILTLPVTILTLGLFTFIINALMVYLVATFVPGFHVDNFWSALFFTLVLSVISSILRGLVSK